MGLLTLQAARQARDGAGQPVAAATLEIYHAGRDVHAVLYSDFHLTNLQENPVRADATGKFPDVYLVDGNYRLVIRDPEGRQLHREEDFLVATIVGTGGGGATGSAYITKDFPTVQAVFADTTMTYGTDPGKHQVLANQIVTVEGGTHRYRVAASNAFNCPIITPGGVKLCVEPTSGGRNVRAFGAVGDGIADDTAAIQRAIDADAYGTVFLPAGTYRVVPPTGGSGALVVKEFTQVSLRGESGTYIVGNTAQGPLLNYCAGRVGGWREANVGVSSITFDGQWTPVPAQVNAHGFDFTKAQGCLVAWRNDNLHLDNCSFLNAGIGVIFESVARPVNGRGAHVYGAKVRGFRCKNLLYGMYFNAYDPVNFTTYIGQIDIGGGWMEGLHKAAFAATANVWNIKVQGVIFDNVPFLHAFGGSVTEVHFGQGQYELGYKDDELQAAGYPEVLDFSDVLFGQTVAAENQKVTGGDFASATAWTTTGNWAISGGAATVATAAAGTLSQALEVTPYRTYEVTLDATVTTGTLAVSIGTTTAQATVSASGTQTFRVKVPATSDGKLRIVSSATFTGSVDNVSVKLVRYLVPFWDDARATQKQLFWGYSDSMRGNILVLHYDHLRNAMMFDRQTVAAAGIEDAPNLPQESVVDRMFFGPGSALRMQSYSGDKGGVGPSVFSQPLPDVIAFKKAAMLRAKNRLSPNRSIINLARNPSGVKGFTLASGATMTDIVADGLLFPHSSQFTLPPSGTVYLNRRDGHVASTRFGTYYLVTMCLKATGSSDGTAAKLRLDCTNVTNLPGSVPVDGRWRSFELILPAEGVASPFMTITNTGTNTVDIRVGDIQIVEFTSYNALLDFRAERQLATGLDTTGLTDGIVAIRPTLDGMIVTTRYTWSASAAAKPFYGALDRDPAPYFRIEQMECRLLSGTGVSMRGENPGGGVTWWFASVTPTANWSTIALSQTTPPDETLANRGITLRPATATMVVEFRTRFRYLNA